MFSSFPDHRRGSYSGAIRFVQPLWHGGGMSALKIPDLWAGRFMERGHLPDEIIITLIKYYNFVDIASI